MIWVALSAGLADGVLVEFFSGAVGVLIASTGLGAGTLRALAILKRSSTEQVERITAVGFAGGAALGALVLVFDSALN